MIREGPPPSPPFRKGTLADYLALLDERPEVADPSHRRLSRMLDALEAGRLPGVPPLFGQEEAWREVVRFFRAAGRGLDVRRRILLLVGPVGAGKSTIVARLKRGLEAFTRLDEGALYAVAGCPLREDPLHLLPETERRRLAAERGLRIEGELCPLCRVRLAETFAGDPFAVPVERVVLSESLRVGIGTFSPTDPKSQDVAELVGSVDFAALSRYGVESDPRAFRFDGELEVANRGLVEFLEMLKVDRRLLYVLLSLAQEGVIKVSRFAMLSLDEAVVGHTNPEEFRAFAQEPENAALLDRLYVVTVPYNRRAEDEAALLRHHLAAACPEVHLAPGALAAAARFAVLSRAEAGAPPSAGEGSPADRLGADPEAVRGTHADPLAVGAGGLSPRFVLNCLSRALADGEVRCLTPEATLLALADGVRRSPTLSAEARTTLEGHLLAVREAWEREALRHLLEALHPSWPRAVRLVVARYLREAARALDRKVDPLSGAALPHDEAFLRRVEEALGVSEREKEAFREELVGRAERHRRERPERRAAFERELAEALAAVLTDPALAEGLSLLPFLEAPEELERQARAGLAAAGYCPVCATALLRHLARRPGLVPFAVAGEDDPEGGPPGTA